MKLDYFFTQSNQPVTFNPARMVPHASSRILGTDTSVSAQMDSRAMTVRRQSHPACQTPAQMEQLVWKAGLTSSVYVRLVLQELFVEKVG